MLSIKNARRAFHAGTADEKIALDGLNLELAAGDFVIIIGSNGAGKSTTLNAISGALSLDEGSVTIAGKDVTKLPAWRRARHVARVFQDPMKGTAAEMSIAENLLLAEMRQRPARLMPGLTTKRRKKYQEQLATLGLGLEDRLDTTVGLLSGGQRQSLSLIMAVSGKPDVLLLDEHTAALDPRTAQLVLDATIKAVSAHQLTTLMVTHNMQHAIDYGNRVVMLDSGKVHLNMNADEKSRCTVPDLINKFAVKTDRMMLES